jgi:hypothetical protein
MALALRVNGLDAEGVKLISPASPDFDELARPLMGERFAHVGLQLKPMLAIVSNDSPHGMKHPASARNSSSTRSTSTRSRKPAAGARQFAVWVNNDGYEASLERNKIHVALPDKDAERGGDLRVVDESGEDYLFTADRFVA